MKKLFAIFLIMVLMLCAVGCQNSRSVPTKAEIAAKYGIEESVIDEFHNKYPKSSELPTKDGEFAEDSVILCVYQFANEYNFTPEDFPGLQCKTVKSLLGPYAESENPSRMLILELENGSKDAVIEAIRYLQLRADVYYAAPDVLIGGY